jgi:hypothetical protein
MVKSKTKPAFSSMGMLEKAGSGKRRKVPLLLHDSDQKNTGQKSNGIPKCYQKNALVSDCPAV